MDWLNNLPPLKGVDRVVAEMAQRLMRGPINFQSPFWDGGVKIETLDDYRAWIRAVERIANELDDKRRALEVWETERSRVPKEKLDEINVP